MRWDIPVARNAHIELERIAWKMLRQVGPFPAPRHHLTFYRLALDLALAFDVLKQASERWGWVIYSPGEDEFEKLYIGASGTMAVQQAFEDAEHLLLTLHSTERAHVEEIYAAFQALTPLPPLNLRPRADGHVLDCTVW
ncbi:hypothetical protein [Deinococcus multiflagellatus]|uniref:Uncharacterized protein n=1 Tax=Deinococcus multiflagellatus TaxID=1656887 RepID=A0ABW1ZQY5_9DEIO